MRRYLPVTTALLSLIAAAANAQQTRCQCTYKDWVGDCSATVKQVGNWIKVSSDTSQCSRVDWYADGEPQLTIVTGGEETQEWLGQAKTPQLTIQSCKICKDAVTSAEQSSNSAPAPQEGVIETPQPVSPFQGRWTGEDKNIYGYSNSTEVQINVQGNVVSGTWDAGAEGAKRISGTITGNKARVKIHDGGTTLTLELVDENTIKYRWLFSSAVLRKQT